MILVDSLIDLLIDQKGKVEVEVSKSQNIRRVGTHEEIRKKKGFLIKFNSIQFNSLQFHCIAFEL